MIIKLCETIKVYLFKIFKLNIVVKIQFDEDDDEVQEVIFYSSEKNEEWNLIELLEALYHMSVNDNIKMDIYKTYSMRDILKKIIYKGNEIEKKFSLKLLYQLCFDEEIAEDVAKQEDLVNFILDYSQQEHDDKKMQPSKGTFKSCNGIMWMIQKTDTGKSQNRLVNKFERKKSVISIEEKDAISDLEDDLIKKRPNKKAPPARRHIMISYNRESRDICLEIKAQLQTMGYSVWIDVDDIRGSSLESMAEAIEVV